jgi:DNA-binding NarL/FixJ family response regulator
MANILISDDHPLTLMGTKTYIESLGHTICDLCSNGITAYNMILQRNPDIAVLDINMPGMNGLEVLEKLQSTQPKTKVILLTMHNEISIFNRAKALNVKGYVLKEFSTDVLEDCINAVLNNETWFNPGLSAQMHINTDPANESVLDKLTFAEKKIVQLISKQNTTKDIAQMLFISEKTVENHRSNIMKKLALPAEKNALLVWAVKNMPTNGMGSGKG